jgi:hypothetical protein
MELLKIKDVLVLTLSEIPDLNNDIMPTDMSISFPETIPITENYYRDKVIGTGVLKKVGNNVFLDLEIDKDSTPATITLSNLPIWPWIAGSVNKRNGDWIEDITITEVGLCYNKNVDPTIKPLNYYLLNKTGE